jgi:5-hydroxyisourate hydrolase-like protein (transthyretin family)
MAAGTALAPLSAAASESGNIVGHVVKAPSDAPLAGTKVTLLGANRDGSKPVRETAITDEEGRFAFKNVPAAADRIYALNARYDGGLFAGGAIQVPSNTSVLPTIKTQLRVWKTTTDPSAIEIVRDDLFVQQNQDGTGVIESIRVQNNTNAAYIGRGGASPGSHSPTPSLGFALPAGASRGGIAIVQSDLDLPELIRTDFGVAATTAIPPGLTRITYSYRVEGLAGTTDVSRTSLYPTDEVTIFAAPPLAIESNRLNHKGELSLGKITYQRWSSADPLAPGDELQVLATAKAGLAPGLLIGIVAGVALLILVVAIFLLRNRSFIPQRSTNMPSRRDLLVAVAKLDRSHDSGEMPEDDWKRERARLISQAERSR